MAAVHSFILFLVVFGFSQQGLGLISDYKLCGDPECESMISRVQAQRDHIAKDCRFLNFKKGDLITVYYKLTGKRNDLWAGSKEKLFGLFPKDAIKVDQLFIEEKKQIQVPTEEFDFICFDENGSVIERSTEFDDLEDLTQETQEPNINEVQDKPTDTEQSEPSRISVQDVSDQNSPETTETGGSSWIGSAVSGWFGRDERSNDQPEDESSEESFRSRKIVMDIEENHVEEKTNSGAFGWIRGELTNAFGFGNKELKTDTQDDIENPTNDKDTSSSWMSMGRDALGFSEDSTSAATKPEEEKEDENTDMEDQRIINPSQIMDVEENNPDDREENENGAMEDMKSENEKEQTGWYGNMYNRITNIYGEKQTEHDENDGGKDSSSEEGSPEAASDTESESSSQSMFSVSGLTSVLKLPFQTDTVEKTDEEQTAEEEDAGKEDFDVEQNSKEQEEEMLIDVDERDSNPTDIDALTENQLLSDKTMTSIESDSTEKLDEGPNMTRESADSQVLENKPSDNLKENNDNVLERKIEQDTRDMQNDEGKTAKEVNGGKEDFDEEQNYNKDKEEEEELIDNDKQDSNPTDSDILNTSQTLSDYETMTLKDSIEQIDKKSNTSEDDTENKTILENKPADNLNEVKSENSTDVSEGVVEKDTKDDDRLISQKDFLKQNVEEDEMSDDDKQESTQKEADLISDTQRLSDETMTLRDGVSSDDIRELDGSSKKFKTPNEINFANNSIDEVIKSKNSVADSADEISEGKLIPNLSDQDNVDTTKKQESDRGTSSTDPVTGADTSEQSELDIHTELNNQTTQESNVSDSHFETTISQRVNADKNLEPTADELSEYNNEKQLAEDKQDTKERDKLFMNENEVQFMDPNEAQLDEAISKHITLHEEKLSDLEVLAMEMSNEHKLDTNINPLDEGDLGIEEVAVISEENLHSDLESNSSLNAADDETDSTSKSHNVSEGIQKAGISIVSEGGIGSQGEYADEVVVHEEKEKSGAATINDFKTKELKDDTPITNETQESQMNTSDGSGDSKEPGHDLSSLDNTEDPDGFTSSTETKFDKNEFFSERDAVHGKTNNMLDQNQSAEHKEETDTSSNEDRQSDSENVIKREESDTSAIRVQRDDGDMMVQSEDKEEQGDIKAFSQSTETFKEYTNLYHYLSEQNIQELLDLFGDHKLSWLDSKMEDTDAGQNNDDLHELGDFEQLLEYRMKHIQQDNGPGKDNTNTFSALQKLFTLLSALREKYSPVITDFSVESPGIREDDCVHEACLDANKDTVLSSKEVENNQVFEGRTDVNDLSNPQIDPVSEEKILSDVEDVQAEEARKHNDLTSAEIKKTTSQNHGLFSEELTESQEHGAGQFYQMAVFVEATVYEIASIVDKVSLHAL